jgi:hypothetical protein
MWKHSKPTAPAGPNVNKEDARMPNGEHIKELLAASTPDQRRQVFDLLRAEFPIHPIEIKLNAKAEVILEAIARSSDLTQRGVRGVLAEAYFVTAVIEAHPSWQELPVAGNVAYDFLLRDAIGPVRIQLKMQRLKSHRPMLANEAYRRLPPDHFVVETQRTRGGMDPATGQDTRPYRFGDFDILAVSMHPSTNDWSIFMYTVAEWLLPRPENPELLMKFQPVAKEPSECWTNNFDTCITWFRSGEEKRIL